MKLFIFHIILIILLPNSSFSQEKNDTFYESIQPYLYENPNKAITIAKNKISEEKNIDIQIKYYLYLAKAYTAKRDFDASFKTLLNAKAIVEKSSNIASKIDVLILIAIQYQQMELYNKCLETLDEVDAICANLNTTFSNEKYSWLGKIYAIRGIIYKSSENYDIALEKFLKAIHNLKNAPQSIANTNNTSIVYYNMGYCFLLLHNNSEAEINFKKAINYAKKSKAVSLEAYALKGLGDNYFLQKEYNLALTNFENAKVKASKIGDVVLNEGIYKGLADSYLSIGNFNEYNVHNELYKKTQFEREQNELKSINSLLNNIDNTTQNSIKEMENRYTIITTSIAIITFLMSFFFIFKTLKINKLNKEKQKRIAAII
ncbi:tetratricopeptide repeat protein [Flavobacterium sp.]|uniref:tetratricopeptide repeat protein n=1 Tax=Flavobacterium sp. TaxID=239 RepID=UPI0035275592